VSPPRDESLLDKAARLLSAELPSAARRAGWGVSELALVDPEDGPVVLSCALFGPVRIEQRTMRYASGSVARSWRVEVGRCGTVAADTPEELAAIVRGWIALVMRGEYRRA
jgi:hypothetical protein